MLLSPVDEMKRAVPLHVVKQEFEWTTAAYAAVGAESEFVILGANEKVDSAGQYFSILSHLGSQGR